MTANASGDLGEHLPQADADMPSGAPWPGWCDDARLDDAALAEAYESTPAPQRACVKQCVALLHRLWGEDSEENTHCRVDKTLGFAATQRSAPAPWALFVVEDAYTAPTRLAAALMPALLARVPHVAVLCVGGMPSVGTRLALELVGIQDIFCVDHASAAEDFVRALCPTGDTASAVGANTLESGSVALLHHGALASVGRTAQALRVPLWEEASPPSIVDATGETIPGVTTSRGPQAKDSLVRFCHPDAFAHDEQGSPRCDAVFGTPATETPSTLAAPLRMAQGLEGFWLHHSLTPAFFRRHRLHMTPHTGDNTWAQTYTVCAI